MYSKRTTLLIEILLIALLSLGAPATSALAANIPGDGQNLDQTSERAKEQLQGLAQLQKEAKLSPSQRRAMVRYLRRIQPILNDAVDSSSLMRRGAKETKSGNLDAASKSFAEAGSGFEDAQNRMSKVTPPKPARRFHGLMTGAFKDYAEGSKIVSEGIDARNTEQVQNGTDRLLEGNRKARAATKELHRLEDQI
jgi:hypothetical protein